MKVILAVIASKNYEAFLVNWKSIKVPENMKIFYVFGDNEIDESAAWSSMDSDEISAQLRGDELWVNCPESIFPGIHLKTKAAFKYLLENEEFDILIRPNLSSLFHLEKLYEWLLDKPRQWSSFGYLSFGYFLSGCGYALTRDVVEDFVKTDFSMKDIMTDLDDNILHKYLAYKGVERYGWEIELYERGKDMSSTPHFHLRFKTEDRIHDAIEQSKYIKQVLNNDTRRA